MGTPSDFNFGFNHVPAMKSKVLLWLNKLNYKFSYTILWTVFIFTDFGPDCEASRFNGKIVIDGLDKITFLEAIQESEESEDAAETILRSHMHVFASWLTHNKR